MKRPKKDQDEKYDERITVRLTAEERDVLEAAAEADHRPVSKYMRLCSVAQARQDLSAEADAQAA